MPDLFEITERLRRLRLDTCSDFAAVALPGPGDQRLRFQYAVGNENDRYRCMIVRSGRGLAGSAILLDRIVCLEEGHPQLERLRMECPVMLAEKLYTAVAIPIKLPLRGRGVLFIGSRTIRAYSIQETDLMVATADLIAKSYSNKGNTARE